MELEEFLNLFSVGDTVKYWTSVIVPCSVADGGQKLSPIVRIGLIYQVGDSVALGDVCIEIQPSGSFTEISYGYVRYDQIIAVVDDELEALDELNEI